MSKFPRLFDNLNIPYMTFILLSTFIFASCQVSTPTLRSTATPDPISTTTIEPTSTPTPEPTPTPTPEPTPTPTPEPTPTPTPEPTPTPTPTPTLTYVKQNSIGSTDNYVDDLNTKLASFDLQTMETPDFMFRYTSNIPQIQLEWVLQSSEQTLETLSNTLDIAPSDLTVYILDNDQYMYIFPGHHPEWTQGFAIKDTNAIYINRAPARIWDVSIAIQEKLDWLRNNVKDVTTRVIAHELTHAALYTHSDGIPRWIHEGISEYIESMMSPLDSQKRQMLQRRYLVRNAIMNDNLPIERILSNDWINKSDNLQDINILYHTSALIVQNISRDRGNQGLQQLIGTSSLDISMNDYVQLNLEPWLKLAWPEETTSEILCTIDESFASRSEIVTDWNNEKPSNQLTLTPYKQRINILIDSINAISHDEPTSAIIQYYIDSLAKWALAIDHIGTGNSAEASALLTNSNRLFLQGQSIFSNSFNKYRAFFMSCTLVKSQQEYINVY